MTNHERRRVRLSSLVIRLSSSGRRLRASKRKVRIFDQTEDIAEWIDHRGHADTVANILHAQPISHAKLDQPLELRLDVVDAPVGHAACARAGRAGRVGVEAKLVASD